MPHSGFSLQKRLAAMASVVILAGLAITWLLLPRPAPTEAPPLPRLRVGGELVPLEGDPVGLALDLVRRYASSEVSLVFPDGSERKLRRSALGLEIDRVRLAELVHESQRPGSALHGAWLGRGQVGEPIDLPLPLRLREGLALPKLLDIKAQVDHAASDAYVNLATKKLEPEKVGYRLDVYGTLARLDAAFRRGEHKAPAAVEVITPRLVQAALGNVEFSEVLGYFETRYTQGERSKDRTYNLRQAASKVDGTVVLPGELFDFNATVGPRDEAHGYRVAPVIAQGELVDGLGGGTCQISGTLHGAAFFAGLDIVERYAHSRPSFYIKLGLDATVVYPTINYRFRNPFTFPIVLHQTVSGGLVRAEILGPKREHTVTYFRRIDEVVPFEEVERESERLPEGKRFVVQRGVPGFRTTSSRVVRNGSFAVREKWSDKYPPTTQIIEVGKGPSDLEPKIKADSHPEYVVDEYLVVTQGPDIRTPGVAAREPGGGTTESREPGRTGVAGWIEKEGMNKLAKGAELGDEAAEEADKPKPDDKAGDKDADTPGDKPSDKPGDKGADKKDKKDAAVAAKDKKSKNKDGDKKADKKGDKKGDKNSDKNGKKKK
jgi:vancomycin resistance protein YoaR